MNRREVITVLGGAAASWPLAARAQQAERTRRVGWLSLGSGPGVFARTFIQSMRERGYTEGQNLAIEYGWAAGKDERLEQLAGELVRKQVDLIVTAGSPATMAAKQATSTIPIVFSAAGAPVEKGLVKSLREPGGNVTGLALITDDIKALQILKEVIPNISQVAFVYDPATLPGEFGETWLRRARVRARALKLDLRPIVLHNPEQVEDVFTRLPASADAMLLGNSAVNALARNQICKLALQRRLPTASIERAFVEAGCLLSYGEDQVEMVRRAATYVDKIFKGARPAELPVEQPTKFQLFLNLKTAKALGLEVPPMVLARADEVIE
jgi:putative tryptophan/tyrosine transport system substrate-binding protein